MLLTSSAAGSYQTSAAGHLELAKTAAVMTHVRRRNHLSCQPRPKECPQSGPGRHSGNAGATSRPVEVLLRKGASSAALSSAADSAADPDVAWLAELGYSADQALPALQASAGDRDAALALLYEELTGGKPRTSHADFKAG